MSVPTPTPKHVTAAHRLVTGEDILEGARQDVMHAGFAIGCWRAFIKNVFRPSLAVGFRFGEDVMEFPKTQHPFFHLRDIQPG